MEGYAEVNRRLDIRSSIEVLQKFNIAPITTPQEDLKDILGA